MFNKIRKVLFFVLVICCVTCFAAGCNGCIGCSGCNDDEKENNIPEALVLNLTENTLNIGDSFKLYVIDSQNLKLSWKSADNKIAEVMQNGTVTAIGEGKTKINVEALNSDIPIATCDITVNSSSGARLVKFDCFEKSLLIDSEFALKATVYNNEGELNALPEISYNSLTEGVNAENIISVSQSGTVFGIKGKRAGKVQILAKIDECTASCVVNVMEEAEFNAEELMVKPYIRHNEVRFSGFPNVEYYLYVNEEKADAQFTAVGDEFSLYLPDCLPKKVVDYYKIKVGYKYKDFTCYTETLDYDTESTGIYNGFTGATSNNSEYISVELSESVVTDNTGKSLKVTAIANAATVPTANRPSLTVSFVNHTDYSWKGGVSQISWKAYLDSNSFVDINGDVINPAAYVTPRNETVNLIETMRYDRALLSDNNLCITGLSDDTFVTVTGKGADKWMKFTLNVAPEDFDKFFTIDEASGVETFKLAMFNTNGFLGYVVDEASDYIKSTGIGYTFYIDDMSFMNLKNDVFDGSYVGSTNYFSVGLDSTEDYDNDGSSLKVTAIAHSDGIGTTVRSTDTAIYLPYGKEIPATDVSATWKAKVDKTSFNGKLTQSDIDYTNFYALGMLTNKTTFFGANNATLSYGTEDSSGWVSYTLSIPKSDITKFFIEKDGLVYFKTVCMNTLHALKNDSNWVSPTNTGYVYYVDALEFYSGELAGAYVGNSKYLAVSYSNDENFTTSTDGSSLKVTAKAVDYAGIDGSGAEGRMANLAVYLPYGNTMPTSGVTVTWKTKLDENSFVDCDEAQGANVSNLNYNCETFRKAAMLTVNGAAYSSYTKSKFTYSSSKDENGWYSYTLTVSADEISTFFIEKDGCIYLRLVCINATAALTNGSVSWSVASTMGYTFYVDDLKFN